MINPTIGLELTFLPNTPGLSRKDFVSHVEAHRCVKQFNRLLKPVNKLWKDHLIEFKAHSESFVYDSKRGKWSKIVEVTTTPDTPISEDYFGDPLFRQTLTMIYIAAHKLNLRPVISRRRGNEEVEFPSGGGHLHCGLNIFPNDAQFLPRLAAFEHNLYIDYVNRPYIRWLFAQWFDDENSLVGLNPHSHPDLTTEQAYELAVAGWAINRRLAGSAYAAHPSKRAYPTYEFRFFDMPPTVTDLLLHVRFLRHWVGHHTQCVDAGAKRQLSLTTSYYDSLKNLRTAWREISLFLSIIGLNPKDYRHFFERNYIPRIKWGKMC